MRISSAICSVLLIAIVIQLFLYILEKKYNLKLVKFHFFIVSKSVILSTFGSVIVSMVVHFYKWENYNISQIVLITILLGGVSVISVSDHKEKIVPNFLIGYLIVVWLIIVFVSVILDFTEGIELVIQGTGGAAISGIMFLACYLLSKKQLGAGDVKLAVTMGMYLGVPLALSAFLFGSVLCCVHSLIRVARKKLTWKDSVPMVPYFMIGLWLILLIA